LKNKRPFRVSEKLRENIVSEIRGILKSKDEVLVAVVFGSFIEKKFARDIDLAVYLGKEVGFYEALEYSEKLSKEIGESIRLLVDVVVLNMADEGILMRAILKGKVVLTRNPLLYHRLKMLALEVRNRFLRKPGRVLNNPKTLKHSLLNEHLR